MIFSYSISPKVNVSFFFFFCLLLHINLCRLFHAKSTFIQIKSPISNNSV